MGIYTPSYSGDTTIPRFDSTSITPINEVYFGETPGIKRCFEAFSAWRSKYLMDTKVYMMSRQAETDPIKQKFVAEMEREFGLYSFSLIIVNKDIVNAMTVPMTIKNNGKLRGPKRVEFTKDGYKFKKECEVSILTIFYSGFFYNSDFSNRECFAALLHEIGHNFQACISNRMVGISAAGTFNDIILIGAEVATGNFGTLGELILTAEPIATAVNKAYNKMTDGDEYNIVSTINAVRGAVFNTFLLGAQIATVFSPIIKVLSYLNTIKSLIIQTVLGPFSAIKAYYGESFADKFAAYYGFGKDLISCLAKFDDPRTQAGVAAYTESIPLLSHVLEVMFFPLDFALRKWDCHPATAVRYKNIVKALESDLNNPAINPKLKKQMKAELDSLEKQTEKMLEESSDIANPKFMNGWMQTFIYKAFGGRDIKACVADVFFDVDKDVNKTYLQNVKLK